MLFFGSSLSAQGQEKEANHEEDFKHAVAAAESWLPLLDQGKYDEGYDATGNQTKTVTTKETFIKTCAWLRSFVGKVSGRVVALRQFRTKIAGGADGNYVSVFYDSTCGDGVHYVEHVSLELEPSGSWKVVGYHIH